MSHQEIGVTAWIPQPRRVSIWVRGPFRASTWSDRPRGYSVRTVYPVPTEERWNENLSMVIGLPCKHNVEHEVGEKVMLNAYAPEPSSNPVGSPLPPRALEDPMKVVK